MKRVYFWLEAEQDIREPLKIMVFNFWGISFSSVLESGAFSGITLDPQHGFYVESYVEGLILPGLYAINLR